MTNIARTLYVGVTNDLERRVYEHKRKLIPGFTARYGLDILVYYEFGENMTSAIEREKQIKGWLGRKKIALIKSMNAEWNDLSKDWYDYHSEEAQRPKNPFPGEKVTDPSLRSG
jgi:putative endonuclease